MFKNMNKEEFFKLYKVNPNDFIATGLKWDDLMKIEVDYEEYKKSLIPTVNFVVESLKNIESIKYIKSRLKDNYGLIEKIIRKRIERPDDDITLKNYKQKITDLAGVKAIHLFKDEWLNVHEYIINNWDLFEQPIVYVRQGEEKEEDNPNIKMYNEKKLRIQEHPKAYRSIHYIIKCQPLKISHCVEIQVRTIFEDGWSEIDHLIRYPNNVKDPILSIYLILFNRLAGHADEMGTFLKQLDNYLNENKNKLNKFDEVIKKLKISEAERKDLEKQLFELKKENMPLSGWIIPDSEGVYPGRLYTSSSSSLSTSASSSLISSITSSVSPSYFSGIDPSSATSTITMPPTGINLTNGNLIINKDNNNDKVKK